VNPEPTESQLRRILTTASTIAVVGASPRPGRASRDIVGYLVQHGYRVIPINPAYAGETIFGQEVIARLADVAEPIDMVDIFRRTEALAGVVDETLALAPKPKVIWMQLGLRDEAAARKAEAAGLTVVMDRCIKIEHGRLGL
jgi:predicted CoA-binding protein